MSDESKGLVAVVTGASRGVGRGVARVLAESGATVYGTGRSAAEALAGQGVIPVPCNHSDDGAVQSVFQRVIAEQGRIDVLVNNAWGGYENMVEDGEFTWSRPFWRQPLWRWDAIRKMTSGIRD